ncbi:MAG: glutathione S-transferase N-terminal domain-containing protein [Sulfurimicrobium sp.]|nr:glutathione S-transferase N-terminal domain-containing protein [Sulfurimicrobium sp.]
MIELHQFRPFWGLPNASPFCMKAETYLRFRHIPYKVVPSGPRKSPTGKIPFIVEDGHSITDSEAIIAHFENRRADKLDDGLSEADRATAFLCASWWKTACTGRSPTCAGEIRRAGRYSSRIW